MSTVREGLDNILSGGKDFLTFEAGKEYNMLFIDWYGDLKSIREHYEKTLKPSYIKCPGKEVCPLCHVQPDKYPAERIKFRVWDAADGKVKFVSLAKTHIKKINQDFLLDELDPTKMLVKIIRTGKGAQDTTYSARKSKLEVELPDMESLDIPDISDEFVAHTPEQIKGFMAALTGAGQGTGTGTGTDAGAGTDNTGTQGAGGSVPPTDQRKLPF